MEEREPRARRGAWRACRRAALAAGLLTAGCAGDDITNLSLPGAATATLGTDTSTPQTAPSATPTHSVTVTTTSGAAPSATPALAATATASAIVVLVTPTVTITASATVTIALQSPTPTASAIATFTRVSLPAGLAVGVAKRDISPSAVTAPPLGLVFLGGYGFGPERRSTGLLAPIYVRAMVIADGTQVVAFAENETQGTFAAYKRGPYGLRDTAVAIETATQGQIPRTHLILTSDHTHSGPDTTGVWGGLPRQYLTFLRDQTAGAVTDALGALQPAAMWTGAADAGALLHSQFSDPPNDAVDTQLRVLVVTAPDDATQRRAVLINFAAHSTVMGADNTLISGDWPSVVATEVEETLGIDTAVVMLADCGRTQPTRPESPAQTESAKLATYGHAVASRVVEAAGALMPMHGSAIATAQLFLREAFHNPFFDLALLSGALARSDVPPWLDGDLVGTTVSAVRIGDLLFAAVPGEAYPAVQLALQEHVAAQQHFLFGLANDQLGYLIAPEENYPQVAAAAPNDNDNALFNVSPAIGDHVTCTLLKAARQIGLTVTDEPSRCARYAGEDNALPF